MSTITQSITAMPAAPDPTSDTPASFSAKAAETVLAQKNLAVELETFRGQTNTVIGEINANTSTCSNAAIATAADRVQTGLDAASASASAASAAAIAGAFVGTSTTSLAIGTGSKTFTTQAGEQYSAGIWMTAVSAADTSNWMFGQVTSYSGTSLVLDIQATGGSGTFADWNLSLTGARGATGAGITEQSVGFTASGGATTKTLTVTGDATISGTPLLASGGTVAGIKYTRDDDGTVSGGTWAIDYANGSVIKATAGADITSITMTNWPATGTGGHLRCMLVNFGAYTITFPAEWKWVLSDLTTTTTFADLALTLPSSGTAIADLFSDDGGTTIYATLLRG